MNFLMRYGGCQKVSGLEKRTERPGVLIQKCPSVCLTSPFYLLTSVSRLHRPPGKCRYLRATLRLHLEKSLLPLNVRVMTLALGSGSLPTQVITLCLLHSPPQFLWNLLFFFSTSRTERLCQVAGLLLNICFPKEPYFTSEQNYLSPAMTLLKGA